MAGDEDETKQIITDIVIDGRVEIDRGRIVLRPDLVPDVILLSLDDLAMAHCVDRAPFCGGHEPCAGIVRYSRFRPLVQRGDECILSEVLGESDVAYNACQAGDEFRRLDSPDRVDCAMRSGFRHAYKSGHARSVVQVYPGIVIPAKAGIHLMPRSFLLPSHPDTDNVDSRFRGNDGDFRCLYLRAICARS